MFLDEDIAGIEKPHGLCLLTFVVCEVLGLLLRLSFFSITRSRSASIISGALSVFDID